METCAKVELSLAAKGLYFAEKHHNFSKRTTLSSLREMLLFEIDKVHHDCWLTNKAHHAGFPKKKIEAFS